MKKFLTTLGILIGILIILLVLFNAQSPQEGSEPLIPSEEQSEVQEIPETQPTLPVNPIQDDEQVLEPELEPGDVTTEETPTSELPDENSEEVMNPEETTPSTEETPVDPVQPTEEPDTMASEPQSSEIYVEEGCQIAGCSAHICANAGEDIMTTCEFRDEYACYTAANTQCVKDNEGMCGWEATEELQMCLASPPSQA